MTSSSIYIENLALFGNELRERGFAVSAAEIGDAARLLSSFPLVDRAETREALSALMAKSERERYEFARAFDDFFTGEDSQAKRIQARLMREDADTQRLEDAKRQLGNGGVPDEVAEAFAQSGEKRRQWIRDMLNRVNEGSYYRPQADMYLRHIATGWVAGAAAVDVPGGRQDDEFLRRNLASITEDESPRAMALIESIVRRANGAAERRRRKPGHGGALNLRATIHASLRTFGVPLAPVFKSHRRAACRMVILCDVSESMYLFSGFALRLITELARFVGRTLAFVFSEGLMEISLASIGDFEETVKKSALWRRGTDAGAAIRGLLGAKPRKIGADTLLIVISDAKTVNMPLAIEALRDASRAARRVIWLNPGKRTSQSVATLAESCLMLGCGTIEELAAACANITQL
jgi:uncharacterized protein with von Willebrand factor type A (vWA) domain